MRLVGAIFWALLRCRQAQPVPARVSVFSAEQTFIGDYAASTLFTNTSQPLYLFTTQSGDLAVLGAWNAEGRLGQSPPIHEQRFVRDGVVPMLWTAKDADIVWTGKPVPAGIIRSRATVTSVRTPSGSELWCVIGGQQWCNAAGAMRASVAVSCSSDQGNSWQELPGLPMPVAGATLVQGPIGTWLVGGATSEACTDGGLKRRAFGDTLPAPTEGPPVFVTDPTILPVPAPGPPNATEPWSGILAAVWDGQGQFIVSWRVVTTTIPVGPRLYPAAMWAQYTQSFYIGAGYIPVEDMWTPGFVDNTPIGAQMNALSQWAVPLRASPAAFAEADMRNTTLWVELPSQPSVLAWSQGVEPESHYFEVQITRTGWLPYNDTGPLLGLPALAFVSGGQVVASTSYGESGWTRYPTLPFPDPPLFRDERVYMRATTLVGVPPGKDSRIQPHTLKVSGVGRTDVVQMADRQWMGGRLVDVYPHFACLPPVGCTAIKQGRFSPGCTQHPWDAYCLNCTREVGQCSAGLELEIQACGASFDGFQAPQRAICGPCKRCDPGFYVHAPCAGKNDTVCKFGTDPRLIAPGQAQPQVQLAAITASAADFLFSVVALCSGLAVGAFGVRACGSRKVRTALAGQGWALPSAPSKQLQDQGLLYSSAFLSFCVLSLQSTVIACLLGPDSQAGGSSSGTSLGASPGPTTAPPTGGTSNGPLGWALVGFGLFGLTSQAVVLLALRVAGRSQQASRPTAHVLLSTVAGLLDPRTTVLELLADARADDSNGQGSGAQHKRAHSTIQSLNNVALWCRLRLLLCDGPSWMICLGVTALAVTQPRPDGGKAETLAAVACTAYQFLSLFFTIHVLSLASMRSVIVKMRGTAGPGKVGGTEGQQDHGSRGTFDGLADIVDTRHGATPLGHDRNATTASGHSLSSGSVAGTSTALPRQLVARSQRVATAAGRATDAVPAQRHAKEPASSIDASVSNPVAAVTSSTASGSTAVLGTAGQAPGTRMHYSRVAGAGPAIHLGTSILEASMFADVLSAGLLSGDSGVISAAGAALPTHRSLSGDSTFQPAHATGMAAPSSRHHDHAARGTYVPIPLPVPLPAHYSQGQRLGEAGHEDRLSSEASDSSYHGRPPSAHPLSRAGTESTGSDTGTSSEAGPRPGAVGLVAAARTMDRGDVSLMAHLIREKISAAAAHPANRHRVPEMQTALARLDAVLQAHGGK